jgi:hypothetical protein
MARRGGRKGAAPSPRGWHLAPGLVTAQGLVRAPGLPAQVSLLLPLVRGQAQAAAERRSLANMVEILCLEARTARESVPTNGEKSVSPTVQS